MQLFLSRLTAAASCGIALFSAVYCKAQTAQVTTANAGNYKVIPPPDVVPQPSQSRLGMNLAGVRDWGTELPFVDVFRTARVWASTRVGEKFGQGPALNLDEHGWVKSLEPSCIAETPFLNIGKTAYPPGIYTCTYEGEGEIRIRGATRVLEARPGRITFELSPADKFKTVQILSTNPANYIRNIHILMPGTEETYKKEPFNPVFLSRWKGFNTFRFMDWMDTNNSEIKEWSDRPKMEDATWTDNGVPLEMMIELCNRTGINPWFCMPHQASDDYVRQFALQVKRDLKPGLKVYIEYSNEIWNSMFAQTKFSNARGVELGFAPADKAWEGGWRYSAFRSVQIFKIWEEVFGGRDRLVRVMATQSVSANVSENKLSFQDAYKYCDALATAPYFGPMIPVKNDKQPELTADKVATWTADQLLDYAEQNEFTKSIESMKKQKAIAAKYGLTLVAYEGGQHMVGLREATKNEALNNLFYATNRHERMGQIYQRYLDAWRETGGGMFCLFSSVSTWGRSGSWGLLENQTESTPKYEAVMQWNRENAVSKTQHQK